MARPVLIVDDDRLVLESISELLANRGYPAHGARDGEEALRVLERVTPGLILLDLIMPVMNSYEFLRRCWQREDLANIPVIVISASNKKDFAGPVEFLCKPIDPQALLAAVRARCGEPESGYVRPELPPATDRSPAKETRADRPAAPRRGRGGRRSPPGSR
jgi:CheY-like chemotaxis protein